MKPGPDKTPDRIAEMFDAIAPRYDLLNRVLSAGIDRRWRAYAIRSLGLTGTETLLDICTGTADVALQARAADGKGGSAAAAARVVGVDFAGSMLAFGVRKVEAAGEGRHVTLVRGDATRLPIADRSVDAVTVAFGIRNVQDSGAACAEMARTLRHGGRLAILEFGVPKIPGIGALYLWYFKYLLPFIGRLVSGHRVAYSYLPESVGTFPPPKVFVAMLEEAGFDQVRSEPLTLGIANLYTARRV